MDRTVCVWRRDEGREQLQYPWFSRWQSITIGNSVVLAGQVGVSDNITIGDNVIAGGASVILSNVPAGRAVLGYPAMKMDAHVESYKGIRRLPRLFRDVAELKKAVSKLTGND